MAIEGDYGRLLGIHPREAAGVLRGPDGEPLRVDIEGLANSIGDCELAAERYIAWIRPTIEDPYEILLASVRTPTGQTLDVKKYIGLYTVERSGRMGLVVYAVWSLEFGGWSMHHFLPVPGEKIDEHRHAKAVLYTRSS